MATQRRQSCIRRVLSVVGVTVALVLGGSAAAWAQTPAERGTYLQYTASMTEFLAATGEAPFDWGSDGCTTPNVKDLVKWNQTFENACRRHDFGYGNFGKGGVVEANPLNETVRAGIDGKFRQDMQDACRTMSLSKRLQCLAVASAYYNVVRSVGKYAFYS